MNAGFELFDHTADVGVRVFAPTLADLADPAARGLYAVIGEIAYGVYAEEWTFDQRGESAAELLRDLLSELLFLFESRAMIAPSIKVSSFSSGHLNVTAALHPVDPERSSFYREVKAVTYHELSILPIAGGFEARYIVDI